MPDPLCRRRSPSRRGRVVPGAVLLALLGSVVGGRVSHACPAQIMGAASTSFSAEIEEIGLKVVAWNYGVRSMLDRLNKLANNETTNAQSEAQANTANNDKRGAEETGHALSQTRMRMVGEFAPSQMTCEIASQFQRTQNTAAVYRAARSNLTNVNIRPSINAPGSGSERGEIQSLDTAWRNRCNNYFNAAETRLPQGMTCPNPTDPEMVDLDLNPWRSILEPFNIPGAAPGAPLPPRAKAAADTIRLLIEPGAPDAMRGAALSRNTGVNIHVYRMRDLTRLGLARGALEDIVARRTTPLQPDPFDGKTNSRLARYIEMVSGQQVAGNSVSGLLNSLLASNQLKNAQVQSIAARLQTQKMFLAEFLTYTEHLLALEAAKLGTKIDETRSVGGGNMVTVKQRN